MKYFASIALLLCSWGAAHSARAQDDAWFQVSADAEYFRVSMPHQPKEKSLTKLKTNFGDLDLTIKSYEASAQSATYKVWVLTNTGDPVQQRNDPDTYLDACAEIIWEGLLKADRDKLPVDRRARAAMTYIKELPAKPLPGREYSFTVGNVTGTTQVYVAESRIFVLWAVTSTGGVWRQKFFELFAVSPNLPNQLSSGALPQRVEASNDETDFKNVFKSGEVTERARVLGKPEPQYTESARKFSITGTVVLRAIFSRNGEVTNIDILGKLPHGLTQQAVKAARAIRFIPARKDGQPVSMWMQLEYNFNLY